jgi:hypothetical protein
MSNTLPSASERKSFTYSACAQTSGIARRPVGRESPFRNGRGVPHLLGNETARTSLRLYRREQRLSLLALSRRKCVMRPLARKKWPRAADRSRPGAQDEACGAFDHRPELLQAREPNRALPPAMSKSSIGNAHSSSCTPLQ